VRRPRPALRPALTEAPAVLSANRSMSLAPGLKTGSHQYGLRDGPPGNGLHAWAGFEHTAPLVLTGRLTLGDAPVRLLGPRY
jgi:hypothetical protein